MMPQIIHLNITKKNGGVLLQTLWRLSAKLCSRPSRVDVGLFSVLIDLLSQSLWDFLSKEVNSHGPFRSYFNTAWVVESSKSRLTNKSHLWI